MFRENRISSLNLLILYLSLNKLHTIPIHCFFLPNLFFFIFSFWFHPVSLIYPLLVSKFWDCLSWLKGRLLTLGSPFKLPIWSLMTILELQCFFLVLGWLVRENFPLLDPEHCGGSHFTQRKIRNKAWSFASPSHRQGRREYREWR